MKPKLFSAALVAACLAAAAHPLPGDLYTVTPENSRIEFHASATFAKVVGVFHDWQAHFETPTGKIEDASLTLEIEAASVKTGSGMKDKTVKGKNFFDVEQNPTIRFVSKRVLTGTDPDRFLMEGDLTLRGVTRPVSIILEWHPPENGTRRLDGECEFNRREFGMVHNVPFNKIADKVSVQFSLEVVNAAAGSAVPGAQ